MIAVIWLIVLNAGDYVTTKMLLTGGAAEANPLAGALLASGYLFWVKMGVLCVLGIGAISIPPRMGVMVLAWFVAGLYAAAVISNALLLQLT